MGGGGSSSATGGGGGGMTKRPVPSCGRGASYCGAGNCVVRNSSVSAAVMSRDGLWAEA